MKLWFFQQEIALVFSLLVVPLLYNLFLKRGNTDKRWVYWGVLAVIILTIVSYALVVKSTWGWLYAPWYGPAARFLLVLASVPFLILIILHMTRIVTLYNVLNLKEGHAYQFRSNLEIDVVSEKRGSLGRLKPRIKVKHTRLLQIGCGVFQGRVTDEKGNVYVRFTDHCGDDQSVSIAEFITKYEVIAL